MSHTVSVKIELRDTAVLRRAVESLNGRWLGHGEQILYETRETGEAFRLPGWTYPLVKRSDDTLAYDDYHGSWGNVADLDRLKARYAIEAARQEAANQGWYAEDQPDGSLLIYHPDGGTLSVTTAGIDANGFTGAGCSAASEPIARAMGQQTSSSEKPEYNATRQNVTQA